MKKAFIIITIAIIGLVLFLFIGHHFTKSHSPEGVVNFENGNLKVLISYSRPYKNGREIFGVDKLVPFGKTWRTGANEATVFETNKDLIFGDKELKAGKYSLWTIPNQQTWQVIFNSEIPFWGVSFDGQPTRDLADDALIVEVPVHHSDKKVFEQFTISVEKGADGLELILFWDKTIVAVPFSSK
ncbi:MAG: DUF2911 domain-containing protein [Bacteroidetes bacterium]|nr:DUF2911 domain-containing protein [Bacteroidota bacterium]